MSVLKNKYLTCHTSGTMQCYRQGYKKEVFCIKNKKYKVTHILNYKYDGGLYIGTEIDEQHYFPLDEYRKWFTELRIVLIERKGEY